MPPYLFPRDIPKSHKQGLGLLITFDPTAYIVQLLFRDAFHPGFTVFSLADIPGKVPMTLGLRAAAVGSPAGVFHLNPTGA